MKHNSAFQFILMGIIVAFLASSCVKEGPQGPAGEDGEDGADGHLTCLNCHSGSSIKSIQAQFSLSAHIAGAIAVDYA